MKIVVSHPTGNPSVRALLAAFSAAGILTGFNTTIAVDPGLKWLKLLPEKLSNTLGRRSYPISAELITTRGGLELARILLPGLGFKAVMKHETGFACLDRVYTDLDKSVAASLEKNIEKQGITAVYAYEDGALYTFTRAKELGLTCIYDLPIAYWETGRKLMQEEALRLPAWSDTLGGGIADSEEKLSRKIREMELADVVVVPGDFVRNSLPDWISGKKIITAPFGTPGKGLSAGINHAQDLKAPLRVLFAGSLGQRKGLADLFEAVKMLGTDKIELVLLGGLMAPLDFYRRQFAGFVYEHGRPHQQVLELMRSCDLLCLPSIVEGRALVMQEAMSQGLPLLITPNTGGDDLVIDGETGWLVPIRNPEKLAEKLSWCLENRAEVKAMGLKAQAHAAHYTWKAYTDQIINALSDHHG